jgi:type II secretory pathway component PulJ
MCRVGLDLAAQTRDAEIDSPVERLHLAVRRHLQQPVALQRAVGIFSKHLKQVEFARCQRLLAVVGGINEHAAFEIEHATAHADPWSCRHDASG